MGTQVTVILPEMPHYLQVLQSNYYSVSYCCNQTIIQLAHCAIAIFAKLLNANLAAGKIKGSRLKKNWALPALPLTA